MLLLKNIVKHYIVGDNIIQALRGVNLQFRKSEFVAVLGPSGCGKTTMLNIVGGLDRYTSGDLSVNGTSTKEFKDSGWDSYRNHSVGFVFQTYNLISHQTVLSNVELALTLSGVSKSQRRQRAKDVLVKVGLGDQIYKKPNQLSGGQMQRVAIARALVNDPEIVLADEPTGALDSETSVQIMELLKEVAKDRLVIMVTHNPDLADKYSTRIIRLLDGSVVSDSDPYSENEIEIEPPVKSSSTAKSKSKRTKKISMSFFTALSLSLNNLMTKKTRTFLTAFAGSIGIIGIALILSLSNGVQEYISRVEEDTLSSYPIVIEQRTMDIVSMMSSMSEAAGGRESIGERDPDRVYSNNMMGRMVNSVMQELTANDLGAFKAFIESEGSGIDDSVINDIKYGYATQLNIYNPDMSDGIRQLNPNSIFDVMGISDMMSSPGDSMGMGMMMGGNYDVFTELLGNEELLASQYEVVSGRMPQNYDEVVLFVSRSNRITDFALYSLGLLDPSEFSDIFAKLANGEEIEHEVVSFGYGELLGLTFKLVLNSDYFEKNGDGVWTDIREDALLYMSNMPNIINNAQEIKVVGIVRAAENASVSGGAGGGDGIGYRPDLMTHLIDNVNASEAVREQKGNPEINIFTGRPFDDDESAQTETGAEIDMSSLSPEQQQYLASLSEEELAALMQSNSSSPRSSYEGNLAILGVSDLDNPNRISLYPKDFDSKDKIIAVIDDYNNRMTEQDKEESVIHYTDFVGLLMSSVSNILNTISIVLIAFVSISLVVSSIMIGIITYISVLERTKEIGVLRSIGASKRDVSQVFNAETMIIGFASGALGILTTVLLCIPANIIIKAITDISGVASLPVAGAVVLIIISVVLTLIAGLIPSKLAANKDPVVALRTE
ncbi:MAG: ABC transporter ATP-binding protein/permease [Oscillospiraceae bacterium]|nr:ABC transporter ATP-binding protein/permease [Oscillospiraceae bacterium]